MTINLETTHWSILCVHCGYAGKNHGSHDNPHKPYACPKENAGKRWDARIKRFWLARKTTYKPRT